LGLFENFLVGDAPPHPQPPAEVIRPRTDWTGLNVQYELWTRDNRELLTGNSATTLHAFLSSQASLRGFKAHQGASNPVLIAWIKSLDALLKEDDEKEFRQPLAALIAQAKLNGDRLVQAEIASNAAPVQQVVAQHFDGAVTEDHLRKLLEKAALAQAEDDQQDVVPIPQEEADGSAAIEFDDPEPARKNRVVVRDFPDHNPIPCILREQFRAFEASSVRPPTAYPSPEDLRIVQDLQMPDSFKALVTARLHDNKHLKPVAGGILCRGCSVEEGQRHSFLCSVPIPWERLNTLGTKWNEHVKTDFHQTAMNRWAITKDLNVVAGQEGGAVYDAVMCTWVFLCVVHAVFVAVTTHLSLGEGPRAILSMLIVTNPIFLQWVKQRNNFLSRPTFTSIAFSLGKFVCSSVASDLRRAASWSLLTDEGRDVRHGQIISIFARYLRNGEPVESLVCINPLQAEDATAASLYKHVKDNVERVCGRNCWQTLRGIATDGCATMSGQRKGLVTRFRVLLAPWSVWMWCAAHQLNLSCIAACKATPNISIATVFLSSIYTFFVSRKAEHRLRLLHTSVKVFLDSLEQVLYWRQVELVEVGETRWLSHEAAALAVTRILGGLYIAVCHFAPTCPDAAKLKIQLEDRTLASSLFLLASSCRICGRYSRAFQDSNFCFHDVIIMKNMLIRDLEQLNRDPASCDILAHMVPRMNEAFTNLPQLPTEWLATFHNSVGRPYVEALIRDLNDRLQCIPVIRAISICDPRAPIYDSDEVDMAAAEELFEPYLMHFSSIPDFGLVDADITAGVVPGEPPLSAEAVAKLRGELPLFCRYVKSGKSTGKWGNFLNVVKHFCSCDEAKLAFPMFFEVLQLGACLPIGTASVERSFSIMGLTRTKFRKCLGDSVFESLMHVSMNNPFKRDNGLSRAAMNSVFSDYIAQDRRHAFFDIQKYWDCVDFGRR